MRTRSLILALAALLATGAACRPSPPPAPPVEPPPVVTPPPDPGPPPSHGRVRLEGKAFADDRGQFNPLGVSLFWALWGEAHDPDRLEANLQHLQDFGVDYVRILGMVGTETWADRRIDPHAPEYWATVDALLERLARHELRAQVTVFADAQVMMPDRSARPAFVDAWASKAEQQPDRFFAFEVANEHWQNGVEDLGELRALGDRLRSRTAVPVALSAPQEHAVADVYRDWPGFATMHYDRDISRADGFFRPVRQPWGWPGEYFPAGGQPAVVSNNEPIGPHSSVAADDSPTRIALAYVTTFVAGNSAYVYHPGAGIRGGGQNDRERGRLPNLYDYDHNIILGLATWRRELPAGMANCERRNSQWTSPLPEFPFDGFQHADDRGDLVQAYATTCGDDITVAVLGVRRSFTVTSRWHMDVTVRHPITAEVVEGVLLEPGQQWTPPVLEGYVIRGRRR